MLRRISFPLLVLTVCLIVPLVNGTLELSVTAMLFPWIIGGAASILLLWEILREFREELRETPLRKQEKINSKELKNFLDGIAWTIVILPLIYLLGFLVAIPLYLFSYLKLHGYKVSFCIVLSLCVEAFFYLVFVVALEVNSYEGLLFLHIMESN